MSQTLAAVGAVLMAVLQSTIVPFLVVDGATPDLLLVDVDGDGTVDAIAELDEDGEVVAIAVVEETDEA